MEYIIQADTIIFEPNFNKSFWKYYEILDKIKKIIFIT